jgi:hypothetical protein
MTFPIVGSNIPGGAFSIDNSLRFNDDDGPSLQRTPSSAGNRAVWTWSAWLKINPLGTLNIFTAGGWSAGQDGTGLALINGQFYSYWNTPSSPTISSALFRDPSAWYHVVLQANTSTLKLYVNSVERSSKSISGNGAINNTNEMVMGRYSNTTGGYFDGYMAEVHFIDGTAKAPTDFGEFDEDSGIWKPIEYTGTYGTNGFYLKFNNTGNIGEDSSGNDNTFSPTNLSGPTDITTDTPTNNFATFNSLFKRTSVNPTFSEGNCKVVQGASNGIAYSTQGVFSGKWYAEIKVDNVGTATSCGILEPLAYDNGNPDTQAIYYQSNGNKNNKGSASSYGASYTTGDIIGIALDADNGTLAFYKNGASQGTAFTGLDTNTTWLIGCHGYINSGSSGQSGNYGNPPFSISSGNSDDNGYGNFEYAPPSGYLALCTQNLATESPPTIDDASQYFNTLTWSGDNTTRSFTGVGFSPDWVWIKNRNSSGGQVVYDSVRGNGKQLQTHESGAEQTNPQFGYVSSFNSDGFTLTPGTYSGYESGNVNMSGRTYVGWNWRGSDSNAVSNTDGSITSTVSANQTAGFSIVTYTGNGSDNSTIGHGLGKAPAMIILKGRSSVEDWMVYHKDLTAGSEIKLNSTSAQADDVNNATWGDNHPSSVGSSTFAVGYAGDSNSNGTTYVAYCFAEIEGYSKFGKFSGNSSLDGPFIHTGFSTKWVMYKNITSATDWMILDDKRIHNASNSQLDYLEPNTYDPEGDMRLEFLSNGFKLREDSESGAKFNVTGETYIYMAFAENPFVTSGGVPVTAR